MDGRSGPDTGTRGAPALRHPRPAQRPAPTARKDQDATRRDPRRGFPARTAGHPRPRCGVHHAAGGGATTTTRGRDAGRAHGRRGCRGRGCRGPRQGHHRRRHVRAGPGVALGGPVGHAGPAGHGADPGPPHPPGTRRPGQSRTCGGPGRQRDQRCAVHRPGIGPDGRTARTADDRRRRGLPVLRRSDRPGLRGTAVVRGHDGRAGLAVPAGAGRAGSPGGHRGPGVRHRPAAPPHPDHAPLLPPRRDVPARTRGRRGRPGPARPTTGHRRPLRAIVHPGPRCLPADLPRPTNDWRPDCVPPWQDSTDWPSSAWWSSGDC